MSDRSWATKVLIMNTIAFTVCFAVWMMNGVLVTFLVDNGIFDWDKAQIGWLIGIPVLTGSLARLPIGILTDKYGGRIVYTILMIVAAAATYSLSFVNTFSGYMWASLGFGISGASFAVGIAYTSVWFSKKRQGTALGIFGAGNAGAALTSMGAPSLLLYLTDGGTDLEGWRALPQLYAAILLIMAVIFYLSTHTKIATGSAGKSLMERLAPLKEMRVWRFGLYYFLVFGGFVTLAQWLIPYYVNVYAMTVVMAGLMASIFSLPSGVIRAFGGWMSDLLGARPVMYIVLGTVLFSSAFLIVPRMDIQTPGEGIMARAGGVVSAVTAEAVVVGDRSYSFRAQTDSQRESANEGVLVLPTASFWQEPVVEVGDQVVKKQLIVRGITHIFFQANVWIFTFLVFIVGIMFGIGKAAVYKYIPEYFPDDVGVVGGIVGVVGGLGGFFGPVIFGYLLKLTGIWTTSWMFFFVLTLVCLIWLHLVARRLMKSEAPEALEHLESRVSARGFEPID
jgi:NNP family nitrate/nitrite transporter-like MFS transporter